MEWVDGWVGGWFDVLVIVGTGGGGGIVVEPGLPHGRVVRLE